MVRATRWRAALAARGLGQWGFGASRRSDRQAEHPTGRRLGEVGAIGAALALAASLAPATTRAEDWPQFGGPRQDHKAAAPTAIARAWPAEGPPQLWQVPVQPGYGGASIHDGLVFVMERKDGAEDLVRCLGLEDGKERWRFSSAVPGHLNYDGSRSVPAVDDKHVYATGPFGHLYCLDRKTGKAAWTKNIFATYDTEAPRWGYGCSPVLWKHLVIVPAMGAEVGLVAFERATGKVAWESPAVGGDSYATATLHTVGGVEQVLFAASGGEQSGSLSGIEAATGKLLWRSAPIRRLFSIPAPTAVGDGLFFLTAGYGSGSVLLEVTKGESGFAVAEKFRIERDGAQIHAAVLHDGHLYANFNNNQNLGRRGGSAAGIWCIDLRGTVKWKTAATPAIDRGALLLVGDLLLVLGGQDGVLRLVEPSPEGYRELAAAPMFTGLRPRENNIWAPMAFSDGRLLVRSQDALRCVDLRKQRSGSF